MLVMPLLPPTKLPTGWAPGDAPPDRRSGRQNSVVAAGAASVDQAVHALGTVLDLGHIQ